MAPAEGVVLALAARGKRGESAVLLDGVQPRAPPGQSLVRIGLMTDIPDDAVVRRIKNVMQCHRELGQRRARLEVIAATADAANEKLRSSCETRTKLGRIELAQICRVFNGIEQRRDVRLWRA